MTGPHDAQLLDVQSPRATLTRIPARISPPLADAITAMIFYGAAIVPLCSPASIPHLFRGLGSPATVGDLLIGAMIEAGLLMSQAMLVDIATRISFRPPWWFVGCVAFLVFVGSPAAALLFNAASHAGWLLLLPLLLSAAQRLSLLWRMPARPRVEKIAARALIGNRCITGAAVVVFVVALSIASASFYEQYHDLRSPLSLVFAMCATHFAIAAFDGWRVQGQRFAANPTVLFRFDLLDINYTEPVFTLPNAADPSSAADGEHHRNDPPAITPRRRPKRKKRGTW
jgi:hypothetical protein